MPSAMIDKTQNCDLNISLESPYKTLPNALKLDHPSSYVHSNRRYLPIVD